MLEEAHSFLLSSYWHPLQAGCTCYAERENIKREKYCDSWGRAEEVVKRKSSQITYGQKRSPIPSSLLLTVSATGDTQED
jgi:hypothetical protein